MTTVKVVFKFSLNLSKSMIKIKLLEFYLRIYPENYDYFKNSRNIYI